jgi:hypothetical protein
MGKTKLILPLLAIGLLAIPAMAASTVVVVTPNNPAGDNFTNPIIGVDAIQPIGASGWYYNNVRTQTTIGITGDYPHDVTGSVYFNATSNGSSTQGKADIETFFAPSNYFSLSDLSSLSYDWYRDGSSTVAQHLIPSLRLAIRSTDGLQSGYIVYEPVYNGGSTAIPVTTDAWVTATIGGSTNLWASGNTLPNNANIGNADTYTTTLAEWQSAPGNYLVTGISSGVGSGWNGTFTGAVDNITLNMANGDSTTYKFELAGAAATPTPLPASAYGGGVILSLLIGGHLLGRKRATVKAV